MKKIYYVYFVGGSRWYAAIVERHKVYKLPINISTIDLVDHGCSVWTAVTSLKRLIKFFKIQFEKYSPTCSEVRASLEPLKAIINDESLAEDDKIDRLNNLLCKLMYITWAEEGEEI